MTSRDNKTSLYKKLCNIKDEMDSWNKDSFQEGVDIKLNRIDENYSKAIELNCNYILSRSNYKVFKALDRYQKRKEKSGDDKVNRGFIEII